MTLVFERDLQFSHMKRGHYLIVIGTTGELLLDIDHHESFSLPASHLS